MVFIADDLGAWLARLLAETGRKGLTQLVLGTEQERALRSAATAAVQLTAVELRPDDDEHAEHVAMVINQVFSEPIPDAPFAKHTTVLEALQANIAEQLAVLDDSGLTGQNQSSAEVLGVTGAVLAENLTGHLQRVIVARGSRGGPLQPLADQLNHDVTHLQGQQTHDALQQIRSEILEAFDRLDATTRTAEQPRSHRGADVALHVEQLLDGLGLGRHEEAERRVNRLFLHLSRDQQRAAVTSVIHVVTTTMDHTSQLIACSLLEAANRLDSTLIKIDEVEELARSADFSLRSSAAVLMWQWAESSPGRVPIPLLGRLALPSTEDWYVHAAARAGAKQLLLRRAAARAIFDRMAASLDPDDRDYAAADLLEVAMTEPRAVPADLAVKLARDEDKSVASRAVKLLQIVNAVGEDERSKYYGRFGM